MKAYTFEMADVVTEALSKSYDCKRIAEAVESDGNANLKIVDTSQRSVNRFTPPKETKLKVSPGKSAATATTTVKFEGNGSRPREFAAWHDSIVAIAKKHGELTNVALPVGLKTWLDEKFAIGKVKVASKATSKITLPARATTPGNGNGHDEKQTVKATV